MSSAAAGDAGEPEPHCPIAGAQPLPERHRPRPARRPLCRARLPCVDPTGSKLVADPSARSDAPLSSTHHEYNPGSSRSSSPRGHSAAETITGAPSGARSAPATSSSLQRGAVITAKVCLPPHDGAFRWRTSRASPHSVRVAVRGKDADRSTTRHARTQPHPSIDWRLGPDLASRRGWYPQRSLP